VRRSVSTHRERSGATFPVFSGGRIIDTVDEASRADKTARRAIARRSPCVLSACYGTERWRAINRRRSRDDYVVLAKGAAILFVHNDTPPFMRARAIDRARSKSNKARVCVRLRRSHRYLWRYAIIRNARDRRPARSSSL